MGTGDRVDIAGCAQRMQWRAGIEQGGADEVQIAQAALQTMTFTALAIVRPDGVLNCADGNIIGLQCRRQGGRSRLFK